MSDKVRGVARKLADELYARPFMSWEEISDILRAELKPLLDSAKGFYDARPYSIRHSEEGTALADELERWGRAKP